MVCGDAYIASVGRHGSAKRPASSLERQLDGLECRISYLPLPISLLFPTSFLAGVKATRLTTACLDGYTKVQEKMIPSRLKRVRIEPKR